MRALIAGLMTALLLAACAVAPTPWTDEQIEVQVIEIMVTPACLSRGMTLDPAASVTRLDNLRRVLNQHATPARITAVENAVKAKYPLASLTTRERCTSYSMAAIRSENKRKEEAQQAAIQAQSSSSQAQIDAMNRNGAALIQAIGQNKVCNAWSWNNSVSCI